MRRYAMLLITLLLSRPAFAQTCSVQTVYPSVDVMPCNGCGKFAWFIVPDGQTWELQRASAAVLMPAWTNGMAYLLALDADRSPLGTMELSAHPAPSGSVTQLLWGRGLWPTWNPPTISGPLSSGLAAPLVLQSGQQIQMWMQPDAPWIISAASLQVKVCQ